MFCSVIETLKLEVFNFVHYRSVPSFVRFQQVSSSFKNPKKMSGDDQQFCLRWNDFQTNMVASFKHLRDEKSFCDVTIATEGQHTKAHKMILCACSPYFKNLLEQNPAKHPIIILKDVPFMHLTAILEFMYAGEVNVAQDQLPAFLKTAEKLKIKGLAEGDQDKGGDTMA